MRTIKILPFENGAHAVSTSYLPHPVEDGYAIIPEGMTIPDTFPFVNIEVDGNNPPVVVSMTPGVVPPPPEPSVEERIAALKAQLESTDYQAIKYAEGWLTDEEYEPIKTQRQEWRDEINKLEGNIE